VSGLTLALFDNGNGTFTLQSNDPINHPFMVSNDVTLEPNATADEFTFSNNGSV
jgi:hypothetical protein